jgi:hypothetical protein
MYYMGLHSIEAARFFLFYNGLHTYKFRSLASLALVGRAIQRFPTTGHVFMISKFLLAIVNEYTDGILSKRGSI